MSIETAIYNLLKDDAGVAAIVGVRIKPVYVPQGMAVPAITYQQLSGLKGHTLVDSVNMRESLWQINCWATSTLSSRTLADAVRGALDNFSGTKNSVVIQCIHLEDEDDLIERKPGTDVVTRNGKRLDFRIWFNE